MTGEFAVVNSPISKALDMLKRIRRLDGSALISGGVFLHRDLPPGTDAGNFVNSTVGMLEKFVSNGEEAKEILLGFEKEDILFLFRYPVILCLFFNREEDLQSIESGGNQFLNQFGTLLGVQPRNLTFNPPIVDENWCDEEFRSALTAPKPRPLPAETPALAEPARLVTPGSEPVSEEKIRELLQEKSPLNLSLDDRRTRKRIKEVVQPKPEKNTEPVSVQPPNPDLENILSRFENVLSKVMPGDRARHLIEKEFTAKGGSRLQLNPSDFVDFSQKLTGTIKDRRIRRLIGNELQTMIDSL